MKVKVENYLNIEKKSNKYEQHAVHLAKHLIFGKAVTHVKFSWKMPSHNADSYIIIYTLNYLKTLIGATQPARL